MQSNGPLPQVKQMIWLSLHNKSKYSHTLILEDVDYNYLGPKTGSETFSPVLGASQFNECQTSYKSLNGNLRLVLLTQVSKNFYHPSMSTGNHVNPFLLTMQLCFVVFIN